MMQESSELPTRACEVATKSCARVDAVYILSYLNIRAPPDVFKMIRV